MTRRNPSYAIVMIELWAGPEYKVGWAVVVVDLEEMASRHPVS